jgi:hypothetical protein
MRYEVGEIKSTLDLVLEKTKNLNLSDKEKRDQKDKELEGRLRGLLQKYEDQRVTPERFESEYEALRAEFNVTKSPDVNLLNVICARIELGRDNQALLELLSRFTDPENRGIRSVLDEYAKAIGASVNERSKTVKDKLAKAHFISGSAIVPNLETDQAWREEAAEIRAAFEEALDRAKTGLLTE